MEERILLSEGRIRSVLYNARKMFMEIEFREGGVRQYFGVPPLCYLGLMNADNKDVYFAQKIESIYAFLDVNQPPA